MFKYKVERIHERGPVTGITLKGKVKIKGEIIEDKFTVWFPTENIEKMDEQELKKLFHEKAKERFKYLKENIIVVPGLSHNKKARVGAIEVEE